MKNTLEYLLAIANYDAPELQRSIFEERANVDFAYLLDNRYLVENGRFGSSVFEMGEPVRVFRNPYDGKFYYDDCGTLEEVAAERLMLFDVDYTPLARLLGETYRCDAEPEEIVRNSLWYLGVPEAGGAEVYLARNIGTNEAVQTHLADMTADMTVMWMGKRPGRRATDARLFKLRDFLLWRDGRIEHRQRWPDSINASADFTQRTMENAMLFRGDYWEVWFDGRGPVKLDDTDGCFYIARILAAHGERLGPLDVAPPDAPPDALSDCDENGERLPLEHPVEIYTREQRREIRSSLQGVKTKENIARAKGRMDEADALKDEYKKGLAEYNRTTRPGGGSVYSVDQMNNVKKRIRTARKIVCDKLANSQKHDRKDLADHWRNFIMVGNDCYYAPDKPREWQVRTRP